MIRKCTCALSDIRKLDKVSNTNSTSLPLTIIIVNLKNPNKSKKNPTLPLSLQNSSQRADKIMELDQRLLMKKENCL